MPCNGSCRTLELRTRAGWRETCLGGLGSDLPALANFYGPLRDAFGRGFRPIWEIKDSRRVSAGGGKAPYWLDVRTARLRISTIA